MGDMQVSFGKYAVSTKNAEDLIKLAQIQDGIRDKLSEKEIKLIIDVVDKCKGNAAKAEAMLANIILGPKGSLQSLVAAGARYWNNAPGGLRLATSEEALLGAPRIKINITDCPITDMSLISLSPLKECKRLETLELNDLKGIDLSQINEISSLKTLFATGSTLTDKNYKQLKTCKNLKAMNIYPNDLSAEKINELQKALPKCEIINEPHISDTIK